VPWFSEWDVSHLPPLGARLNPLPGRGLPLPLPDPEWGLPSLGGAIVTAGGLVFIGGAMGYPHFRAFDIETGKLLWTAGLPAAGNATPMTYTLTPQGKQYVVIAAGGRTKFDAGRTDSLEAFALP